MGFTMHDRMELLRLTEASEEKLGNSRITDWLSPPFFQTNFWYMWQTTFAFQPWHSAVNLKRYLHRFMNEFPRIETLAGVKRTVYNQYDSIGCLSARLTSPISNSSNMMAREKIAAGRPEFGNPAAFNRGARYLQGFELADVGRPLSSAAFCRSAKGRSGVLGLCAASRSGR
jgi:hypothetical protein